MNTYFITGTDTNCGKTFVTCRLLDHLHSQNQKALAIKPIASGGIEDIVLLKASNPNTTTAINRWAYPLPIAPHLAAQQAGHSITADHIARFCASKAFRAFDHLLIEGAGGLMVPLNQKETWIDFLKLSQIPVILVVGMKLGCINHALLSARVLQAEGIPCLGWIANCIDPDMLFLHENLDFLIKKLPMPLLATVPFQTSEDKVIHVSAGYFKQNQYIKTET